MDTSTLAPFRCQISERAIGEKSFGDGSRLWLANDLQSFPCFGFLINKRHYGAKFDGLVDDPSASCRSGCGVVSCVILDAGGAAGTGKWRCRDYEGYVEDTELFCRKDHHYHR